MKAGRSLAGFVLFLLIGPILGALGQPQDGKLQIHHIDVGQGDAALLISPEGETVLIDMGEDLRRKDCRSAIAYIDQLGVKEIDYLFISHYHFDHIGCVPAVLKKIPLSRDAYDRGPSYKGPTFAAYVSAVKAHRKTAKVGTMVTLDSNSANAVKLRVIAVGGRSKAGGVSTQNENDLSLSILLEFGAFREEIGGDLSGKKTNAYQDIETPVAREVGGLDVYKVHHHCSSYSSNAAWMAATKPTIAIISTGNGNVYHHPAGDCLARLHNSGVQRIYWTERGNGAAPETRRDFITGDLRIEVAPKASTYVVSYRGSAPETFQIKAAPIETALAGKVIAVANATPRYAWSKRSRFYHEASCPDVAKILEENFAEGNDPPADKKPAECVQKTH